MTQLITSAHDSEWHRGSGRHLTGSEWHRGSGCHLTGSEWH